MTATAYRAAADTAGAYVEQAHDALAEEIRAAAADLKFWLEGVRFWAMIMDTVQDDDDDAKQRALDGLTRCHQTVTDLLDAKIGKLGLG